MNEKKIYQGITALLLVLMGVLGRIYLRQFLPSLPSMHITINGITQPMFIADMFFIVAIISLFCGILLRGYYTLIVPISVMLISDVILGNSYVFFFTWSGFAFIAVIGYYFSRKISCNPKATIKIVGIGIGSILLYDVWTNFGWWLGPYYPHTIDGLLLCYTLAFPFIIWHLLSTISIIALITYPLLYVKENKLRLKTISPIEHYSPLAGSVVLVLLSILTIY